jgi:hypothetical protein
MHIKPTDPIQQHKALVKNAQKWVAQTFYGTLLKQSHESPFKDKMFSGGRGGEAFGSMLDGQLAERMARGSGNKLVNAIVGKIERANHISTGKKPLHGITVQPFPGGAK